MLDDSGMLGAGQARYRIDLILGFSSPTVRVTDIISSRCLRACLVLARACITLVCAPHRPRQTGGASSLSNYGTFY